MALEWFVAAASAAPVTAAAIEAGGSSAISNSLIIAATLLGPILAVQAQKWVERAGAKGGLRMAIFRTLMTTRADRVTPPHVEALNSIVLAFDDGGRRHRSEKCQQVLDKWREYLGHLSTSIGETDAQRAQHHTRVVDLFVNLLESIAKERGFEIDRAEIVGGAYHPDGFVQNSQTGSAVMSNALAILEGRQTLRVTIDEHQ